MKASAVLSLTALLGFATASPVYPRQSNTTYADVVADPMQELIDALAALPYVAPVSVPVTKRSTGITKRGISKRGTCQASDPGNWPQVVPDTDTAFLANSDFSNAANTAVAPPGYFLVSGFQNKQASAIKASYSTYISDPLTSYNPAACAAKCATIDKCVSFNIFFERDASIDIDADNCPTAPSVTRIKCSFYTTPLVAADATNYGEGGWITATGATRFHTVIAGSNAYSTAPQPIPGFTGPVSIGTDQISAPVTEAANYMTVQTKPANVAYDPAVCAQSCLDLTAYNLRHPNNGVSKKCVFFDAFMATAVSAAGGTTSSFTCTFFTKGYGPAQATNHGQTRSGVFYGATNSVVYTLDGY